MDLLGRVVDFDASPLVGSGLGERGKPTSRSCGTVKHGSKGVEVRLKQIVELGGDSKQ